MNSHQITVIVNGIKPAPWAGKEWVWRRAIADEARKQYQGTPSLRLVFEVRIIFYLLQPTLEKSDLDNLTKPVLDTLFLPNNPQVKDKTLTGTLFEVDDSRVFKLSLEKRLVSSYQEEGAEINVVWEE